MIALPTRPPRRVTHTTLVSEIRAAVNRLPGCHVWLNAVGEHHCDERHLVYGLAVGSADLVGIASGRFVALEVKVGRDRLSPEQRAWLAHVRELGGVAVVVRSVDEALEACRDIIAAYSAT